MAYAEVTQLASLLQIRDPSTAQTERMERKLDMATGEIDKEIALAADTVLTPEDQATLEDVCLRRAQELWHLDNYALGFVGSEAGTTYLARDSWKKYSIELWPIKDQFGFA